MARKINAVTDKLIRPSNPNVMTAMEVAEYLGVSVHTVHYLAHAKKLPGKKIGRSWRFYKPNLDDFMAHR